MAELTQERLKELLEYDPDTGIFTWRVSKGSSKKGSVAGAIGGGGYRNIMIDGKQNRAHRLAFLYMSGYIPEIVDHIDGVKDNNSWINLREACLSTNQHNSKKAKNNTSGVKGVSKLKKTNKWESYCRVNGKKFHLGRFTDIKDAEEAVRKFREDHHGEFHNHG